MRRIHGIIGAATWVIVSTQPLLADPFSVKAPGAIINEGAEIVGLSIPAGLTDIHAIEVEVSGLTYSDPSNLAFYLVNPLGSFVELLSYRGGALPVSDIELIFSDSAGGVPAEAGPLTSGTFKPEGLFLGLDGGLAQLAMPGPSNDPWIFLIVAVDPDIASGAIGSITLRGTGVPQGVPTVSEWGLVVLTLTGLIAATILFRPAGIAGT